MSDPVRPDLDALEALLSAGTPGPWHEGHATARCTLDHGNGRGGHGMGECQYTFDGWRGEETSISRARDWQPDDVVDGAADDLVAGTWDYDEGGVRRPEDVAVIVAIMNAAPALIAYARALDAQLTTAIERADLVDARTAGLIETTVRRSERERCARELDERGVGAAALAHDPRNYSRRVHHLSDAAGFRLAAAIIRALPDREETL